AYLRRLGALHGELVAAIVTCGRISWHAGAMKRIGIVVFYAVGVLAMLYLALYAYAVFRGRDFTPGDPIHIFRNPGAPSYS
ncbi:MAG: hypothetical protein ACRENC_13310, partial [Gemmatimonadaceae bacterium]